MLTYTYPLKFLFTLIFSGDDTYLSHGVKLAMIREDQVPTLMYVYGIGYMLIYLLFYLMHRHARNLAQKLELTPYEIFETNSQMYMNLLNVLIGLFAIIINFALPGPLKGLSGYTYFLIPFAFSIFFSVRARKSKKLFEVTE